MVNEMNPELFRVGDHIRFTEEHARGYSVSHYKGDTGGKVTGVGVFGARTIYWIKGHTYGVYHEDVQPGDVQPGDVQPGDGPW